MFTIEFYYATCFNLDNRGKLKIKFIPVLGSDGTYKLDGRIKTLRTACQKATDKKESLSIVKPSIAAYRVLNNITDKYETGYITFEDMRLLYDKHNPKIYLSGNYLEFYVHQDDIDLMPLQGHCDYACEQIAVRPYIQHQLEDKAEKIVKELYEHGAWGDVELQDKQENIKRLLWILISDYKEQQVLEGGE